MSKRETALAALAGVLRAALAGADVKRNVAVPVECGPGGLVILYDGEPGEPEVTLSPPSYAYEHAASLNVFVDLMPGDEGSSRLDALLADIGAALDADRTLGGAVDHLEPSAPDTDNLPSEAGASLTAARVTVTLIYTTTSPLG
ncbi:hypothetical protein [Ancylobacter mangrovi]|uniref:hypothetical protein n=1 Tax=Ancylobacter mangrovi TaxID=2972472 RepID=UPI002162DE95|nr:hypothetical protein [Ancylobacter mangrovi]MCS0501381.1 hypothetical protein [Ancylobacter mangrovi]